VPLTENTIPTATEVGYLSFKNSQYGTYIRDLKKTFIPYANTDTD
jgi:hypothetical protein